MSEPTFEEPAWLTSMVDQRLALMAEHLGPSPVGRDYEVVMTPLTEPAEDASEREREMWEYTCDNCGRYCPNTLLLGSLNRKAFGAKVTITFGACPRCAGR